MSLNDDNGVDDAPAGIPPQIPPAPVPTAMSVASGPPGADGKPLVLLIVSTPLGSAVYFLDAQMACVIGAGIAKAGRQAATGIVLP